MHYKALNTMRWQEKLDIPIEQWKKPGFILHVNYYLKTNCRCNITKKLRKMTKSKVVVIGSGFAGLSAASPSGS